MAVSCEPNDLIAISACYDCIPEGKRDSVKIYLLAVTAGLQDQTTDQLMEAARCYGCISEETQKAIENYLLCQIANV